MIAAPGYPFLSASLALLLLGWFMGWRSLVLLALAAGLFFAYFFRDPDRQAPGEPWDIVSPADGKVILVDAVGPSELFPSHAQRVAIFMNVFDVHVNRAPLAGWVVESRHYDGQFLAAFKSEADQVNERQVTVLERDDGRRLKLVQIAGLLARRIIPSVKSGDNLARGQRLGMIFFGSRVDLYLPQECELKVQVGDRLKAGISLVGRWH